MKRNDIILTACFLLLALLCTGIYFFTYQQTGSFVQITVDNNNTKTFALNKDTVYTIHTENGEKNVLEIKNGSAQIISADCPDKLCVHQKKISKQGETLVCLPHKVVVSVISKEKSKFDGIAQ